MNFLATWGEVMEGWIAGIHLTDNFTKTLFDNFDMLYWARCKLWMQQYSWRLEWRRAHRATAFAPISDLVIP